MCGARTIGGEGGGGGGSRQVLEQPSKQQRAAWGQSRSGTPTDQQWMPEWECGQ